MYCLCLACLESFFIRVAMQSLTTAKQQRTQAHILRSSTWWVHWPPTAGTYFNKWRTSAQHKLISAMGGVQTNPQPLFDRPASYRWAIRARNNWKRIWLMHLWVKRCDVIMQLISDEGIHFQTRSKNWQKITTSELSINEY